MFDLDARAYRVLMRLKKAKDSRSFKPSQAYWLSYLVNRGLAKNESAKNEENEDIRVAVITQKGISFIKDTNKEKFKVWAFRIIPLVISAAALIIALLK
jgi:hypothetical protein